MYFTFLPNNYNSHRVCCTIRFILTPAALSVASTWYVCLRCPGTFCTGLYELFYTMSERYCSNVILGADCISESLGSWYSNLRSLAGGSAYSTPQWTVYKVCRGHSLHFSCTEVCTIIIQNKTKISIFIDFWMYIQHAHECTITYLQYLLPFFSDESKREGKLFRGLKS